MKIEIDQSGKIENTNKPTALSFSNSKNKTLIISSSEKQRVQRHFRKAGKPKLFIYATFAVAVCFLLKYERSIKQIIIDTEYPGQEALVKNYILTVLRKSEKDFDKGSIIFKQVGKKSKAHNLAWKAYRNKKADIRMTALDIMKYFKYL